MQRALDIDHIAYRSDQVDQAIDASSRAVEDGLHWAHIHPQIDTRYFDYPNQQHARSYELWLGDQGLISLTSLTAGGVAIASTDWLLEPVNSGPPYTRIEIDLGSSASFSSGATHQQAIAAVGLWGVRNDELAAGSLGSAGLATTSTPTMDVTDGSKIGVGSLVRCENERLIVTDRAWVDSTFNLAGDLTADDSNTAVTVSGGTWVAGESIIIGSEEMPIRAVTGLTLAVERAANGTVLAAHTGPADVYVNRRFTVTRGAEGTTAATHAGGTALAVWDPPAPCEALCVALAMDQVEQELGAYSRTVRSGEASADATGSGSDGVGNTAAGIPGKWALARAAFGRMRTGAI